MALECQRHRGANVTRAMPLITQTYNASRGVHGLVGDDLERLSRRVHVGVHNLPPRASTRRRCKSKVPQRTHANTTGLPPLQPELTRVRPGLQAPPRRAATPRRAAAAVAAATPKKVLMMGGTRFIGLYLARQLVQEGHEVTLFTRGKSEVCPQIPDDTDESYKNFAECAPMLCRCSTRDEWSAALNAKTCAVSCTKPSRSSSWSTLGEGKMRSDSMPPLSSFPPSAAIVQRVTTDYASLSNRIKCTEAGARARAARSSTSRATARTMRQLRAR
jgi:NAD dependent epimerase/dehydratase family